MPGVTPNDALRTRVLVVTRHRPDCLRRDTYSDLWQVLQMGWREESAGIQDQDAQANSIARPANLFGDVSAIHAGTDHNNVEWFTTVIDDLVPGVARVSAQQIMRKARLLDVHSDRKIRIKLLQSGSHTLTFWIAYVMPLRGLLGNSICAPILVAKAMMVSVGLQPEEVGNRDPSAA